MKRSEEVMEILEAYVNGHRVLPTGGHRFSPVAAVLAPRM